MQFLLCFSSMQALHSLHTHDGTHVTVGADPGDDLFELLELLLPPPPSPVLVPCDVVGCIVVVELAHPPPTQKLPLAVDELSAHVLWTVYFPVSD